MKDLNLNVEVDNHQAYKACLDIQAQSPYPRLPLLGIKFNGLFAFLAVAVTASTLLNSELAQITAYLIAPLYFAALIPPYWRYIKPLFLFVSDQLMTEFRTKRIQNSYLRNFYDS